MSFLGKGQSRTLLFPACFIAYSGTHHWAVWAALFGDITSLTQVFWHILKWPGLGFFLFLKNKLKKICLWLGLCVWVQCPQRPEEQGVRFPRAGVTGSCVLAVVNRHTWEPWVLGNPTQVIYSSSAHFKPLSHLSSPVFQIRMFVEASLQYVLEHWDSLYGYAHSVVGPFYKVGLYWNITLYLIHTVNKDLRKKNHCPKSS